MFRPMLLMLIAVGVVFGAVFGLKWFGLKAMNDYVNAMPLPTETVSTTTVKRQTWDNEITAVGNVLVFHGVNISNEVPGVVRKIHFASGDFVNEGELLVSLDADNERAEYQRLVAVSELAELNRVRREKLWKLDSISKSDYDATASEAKAANAAVKAQAARIALKEIRAPFDGKVGLLRISKGQYLEPGYTIATLTALDPILFEFSLPERWQNVVKADMPLTLTVKDLPNQSFDGKVDAFEPGINEATREYQLHAKMPNPDGLLRPGQFGTIRLQLPGSREVMPIPRTAINYDSYGSSVWVVVRSPRSGAHDREAEPIEESSTEETLTVEKRFVRTGDARGDYVLVEDGLNAGEEIVTSGLFKLRNGQPITIDNELAPKVELAPTPGPG